MGARIVHYRNTGGGKLSGYSVHLDGSAKRLYATAVGDLDGPPSYGVKILSGAKDAQIRDLVIRGFAVGVDVLGANSKVTGVTVEDPDLFGVRVKGVGGVVVERLTIKNAVRGIGLQAAKSSITVKSSILCPAGYHHTMTFIGAECISTSVTSSDNQASLNNGCGNAFMKTYCP